MYPALSVLVVFALLVGSEVGWRRKWLRGELGRKAVHILVGSFVAFWPFFMTWDQIRVLSLAFLAAVIISERLKVFTAIHSVQRPTFGEICFALVVGALTFVTHNGAIYTAAVLQMSLADGFAAVVGTRFGGGNRYHIFGHAKSVIGTLTFVVISAALLTGYAVLGSQGLTWGGGVFGTMAAAVLENVAPLGLDNLLVPLFIALLLVNRH